MANKFNGRWQVFGPAGTDYTSFFQPAGTVSGGETTLTVTNGDGTSIIYAGTGLSEAGGVLSGTVTSVTVKALGGATLATLTGTLANTFIFDTGGLSLFGGTALYNQLLSGDNLIVGSANGTPGAHEILAGGAGNDIYQPGNGNTTISDGGGTTTLDLSGFAGPATVDLLNQTFTVAGATGNMSGVGSIIGTALGDTITEQTDAVFDIKSGAGNDVIDATGSTLYGARTTLDAGTGDDTVTINQFGYGYLDGGAGNDTLRAGGDIRYYNFTNFETLENTNFLRLRTEQLSSVSHITNSNPFNSNQVGVELWTAGTVDFGRLMAPGVTAVSVGEVAGTHVNGTAGNDSFQDVSNGLIDSFSTPSTFSGRGGDDTLFDNSGNVTAEFSGKMADYTIVHAPGLGSDYLVTDNRLGSPDGTDTLVGVNPLKPMLQFADYFASISEQQAYKADNTQLPGQIYNGFLDLFGPNNFDYEAMFPALGKAVSAILSGTGDTYTINYQGGTQIVFKGSGLTTSNQFAPSGGLVNDITVYDTSTPGAPVKLAHFYNDAASNHLMKVPFTSDILTGGTRVYQLLMSGNNRILGSSNDDLISSDQGNNELDAAGGFNTLRLGPNVDSSTIQYTADGQISSVSFVDEEANYLNFNIFDPNHPIIVNLNNVTKYHNDHFFMPPPPPPDPPAQPKPSAKAGGDPHITSLDGVGYSFHALGEFVLSKSTVPGDPFELQMRTIPYVGLATVIQQTATSVGTDRVTFDASRANVVHVNGLNVDFSSGPVHLNGGTLTKLAAGEWIIAYDTGETLDVIVVQTAINFLSVGLDPGTHRGAGTLSGIWGNFDGDRNNDYQLADGTILPRPISKDVLYHAFADAWRVDQAHSLLDYGAGETTGTFTSTATPTTISLTDLPADVLAKADALVAGAGIADPGLREFAIYDYVVTGDTALITSIAALGQSGGGTLDFERPNSGPPATMLGVIATEASVVEAAGNAATPVTFEVYRTGPIIGDVTVNWTVAAPAAGYFVAADFPGGILPSGQVTIPSQSSSATFTVNIPGGAVTLASELLQVQISSPGSVALLAAVAQAEVVNNAPATGAMADAEFLKLAGGGTLTHVGNAWTLDLGTVNQNTDIGDIRVAVANMAPASGNDLSGTFGTSGNLAAIAGASSFLKLGGGGVKGGITAHIDTSHGGIHTTTLTLNASESNATGFSSALPNETLTITANINAVNAAPTAVAITPALTNINENTSTASHIKVGDIAVTDDGLGTNVLSLTGADAAAFEISGNQLFLKAGVKLDFETKSSYSVAAAVDDASTGATPDAISAVYHLAVNNVSPEILTGTPGKETLAGGSDRDIIKGGLGKDTMTGGAGNDVFIFTSVKDSGKTAPTRDVITDFKHSQDKIDLSAIDAIAGTKKNDAFKFIGTADFHHVKGELHYFKIDAKGTAHDATIVEGDVNGDGKADFQIELSHLVTLTKGDFIL